MTAPVRRQPASKPELILAAAAPLFLERGYGAVSMDEVARAAGVSKATVYAHFTGKDALFAAMVAQRSALSFAPLAAGDLRPLGVEGGLRALGRGFLTLLVSPEAVAAYRIVVAEAHRFPELARAFYDSGPSVALARVAEFLADADRRGALAIPDPALAAEQFLGMLKAHLHLRLLLRAQDAPAAADLDRFVDGAVRLMMEGHRPR